MFSEQTLARMLVPYIVDRGSHYGKNTSLGLRDASAPEGERKTIVVEFSSPNVGKEFDGAHLRSTIVGNFLSALYESMGWRVCRMNFLGDWGKHIGLLAVGWARFGSEAELEIDPLKHLLEVSLQIDRLWQAQLQTAKNAESGQAVMADDAAEDIGAAKDAFFQRLESGDSDALNLWKRFRDVSVAAYQSLYRRMQIDFDEYSGESEVSHEAIQEVEEALKACGIYEDSDQAWIIDFPKHGHPGLGIGIARYRNGTTSYLLRDIAAALQRYKKHHFDKMLYVVSARQTSHFKQVFAALELMGRRDLSQKLEHVSFGKDKGLTPEPGGKLLLGDILDKAQATMHKVVQSSSGDGKSKGFGTQLRHGGELSALMLMALDLSGKRGGTSVFDVNKINGAEGRAILRVQECFERLDKSLEVELVDYTSLTDMSIDISRLDEDEAQVDMLRHLIQFPGVVRSSFKTSESYGIVAYLHRLADLLVAIFDASNISEKGVDSAAEDALIKPLLQAVRYVMSSCLRLLGLYLGEEQHHAR